MATGWAERARDYRGRVTFWPVLAVAILTAIQQGRVEPTVFGWSPWQGALVGLGGLAAFAAVAVCLRAVTRGGSVGLVSTVAVWALASLARVIGLVSTAGALGLEPRASWNQLGVLFVTTLAFAIVISILEQSQTAHRGALSQLQAEQRSLEQRIAADAEELATARANVADAVERQIQPVREACRLILAQDSSWAIDTEVRSVLRSQVEQVLRPASQQLLDDAAPAAEALVWRPPTSPSLQERLELFGRQMGSRDAIRPAWPIAGVAILATLILASVPQITDPNPAIAAGFAATAVSMLAVWGVWRAGLRPRPRSPWGWAGAIAAYVVTGIAASFLVGLLPVDIAQVSVALFGALIVIFGMLGSTYYAVRASQRLAEAELAATLTATAELDARLRREVWFERRRLASVLHGRVQSRLIAAATHLSEDATDPGSVDEVRAHINEALVALDSLRTSREGFIGDPMAALEEIAAVWAPTMSVELQVRADDLDGWSPATIAAMCDIATEGVLNARKHGEAEHVVVSVSRDLDALRVQITDDGAGLSEDSTPGLGSRFLDSVASNWTRATIKPRGTSLVADLRETPTTA